MKPWVKATVVAIVHVALVASLGAKLLYDRATLPRVWVLTAPYDPLLPIRGRYVQLRMAVEVRGVDETATPQLWRSQALRLRLEGDRLVAEALPEQVGTDPSALHVVSFLPGEPGRRLAVLDRPLALFIPESIPDPSQRPPGEALWVEVTVPPAGPPRPIRLGVKRGDGPIEPLATD